MLLRFGMLRTTRIGPLAFYTGMYLKERDEGKRRLPWDILIPEGRPPANHQLLKMIKRRATVWDCGFLIRPRHWMRRLLGQSPILLDFPGAKFMYAFDLYRRTPPPFSFTPEEIEMGRRNLKIIGIPEGSEFFCFAARDRAYLKDRVCPVPGGWAFHDHRNSDIRQYSLATRQFASEKLYGIRVGSVVEKPLDNPPKFIIDYSTRFRSDFMDIFLAAHCRFFLGDTSGIFTVAHIFGVPVALANWVPIGIPLLSARDLFIPKKVWKASENRFLSFREIVHSGIDSWSETVQYERAGLEPMENTSGEIADLVREMIERLSGIWVPQPEDERLQDSYKALFEPGHCAHGSPARVGAEFLRANRQLLD